MTKVIKEMFGTLEAFRVIKRIMISVAKVFVFNKKKWCVFVTIRIILT